MDEFKKPCLPIVPPKLENPDKPIEKEDILEKPINKEKASSTQPPTTQVCPYKIPPWSKCPSKEEIYGFEILKSGQIIDEVKHLQNKAYWTFGRLPENDIEMAHPTISRFHAILQYRPKVQNVTLNEDADETDNKNDLHGKSPPEGWYIYDLDSTHGTFLNKQRIPPKVYIRIRVGHILRLGASTRSYILQGPTEDEEPESELSVTELKAKRQQELEEAALAKKRLAEEAAVKASNEGCSWGMAEDADEETDLTHNPFATSNNEDLFLDDPKKTLRGYFEREGLELVYKCDEMSAGSFVCRVELPLDDTNGRAIVAEVVHKGRKKDCVVQCALEACRLLDRHGVLRQANQEPLKRKQKSKDSGSDDDEFWDRTGDVARKKLKKANANSSVTLTYEDLLKQESDLKEQLQQIESNIISYQEHQKRVKAQKDKEGEDLDAYMENLQDKDLKVDKTEIRKLRLEEQRIKSEQQKVQRLIRIAKPLDLSFIKPNAEATQSQENKPQQVIKKQLPMIGKRNQFSKFKILKTNTTVNPAMKKPAKFLDSDEEEVEDDENQDDIKSEECIKDNNLDEMETCSITEEKVVAKSNKSEELATLQPCDSTKISKEILSQSDETSKIEDVEKESLAKQNSIDNEWKEKDQTNEKSKSDSEVTSVNKESDGTDSSASSKKRRTRIRQRGKRQEVDIDDDGEYESTDKYAKWVPPDNQTGDGFTELNKKFGY